MSLFGKLFNRKKYSSKFNENFSFDPLNDEFIDNPYPTLHFLQTEQPLHRSKSGAWILTRHDDIKSALSDERLSNAPSNYAVVNERNKDKYLCAEVANNILPFIDPPKHINSREIISKSYFHSLNNGIDNSDLTELAIQQAESLKDKTTFDVIHDYGTPFSTAVMCRFMGFPDKDKLTLTIWSEYLLVLFSIIPDEETLIEINENLELFRDYVKSQLQHNQHNGWLTDLIEFNKQQSQSLTEDEIVDNLMLIFADGVENVDRMLGTVCKCLFDMPEYVQQLKQDAKLIEPFIDECLRFESPVQFIGRIAKQDIVIHRQLIKAQSAVLLMLGAANRDPEQFEKPNEFLPDRDNRSMLSFGRGPHTCLGRSLVRKQLGIALQVLLDIFPTLYPVNDKLIWEKRLAHRWLKSYKLSTQ